MKLDYLVCDVPLWSVTVWDKKFTEVSREWQPKTIKYKYLLSSELDEINVGGEVLLLYTGQDKGSTTVELAGDALAEGEIISIPWGGTPSVKYHFGKFVTGDNRIATSAIPDSLLNKYIYYFLKGRIRELESYYRGAGLKHPSMKAVLSMKISYPSVEQQKKVIAQFEAIEAQIALSKNQLSRLDQLIKSRFVEMFGDPDNNPKGFDTKPGLELFKIANGKTKPNEERFQKGVPAYGGNGVSWYTTEPLVNQATIVIGRVGRHCGNTRLVEEPCWITDNAMYVKEFKDNSFNLIFLSWLMEAIGFNRFADEGDLWKITQTPFMEYDFYIPPINLQREFADFVVQVDKSRFAGCLQVTAVHPDIFLVS